MLTSRDFIAEYKRRIALSEMRSLSRSQARGHAKASEQPIRPPKSTISDARIQLALSTLRREQNFAAAAKSAKISPERLRKYAVEKSLIEKTRGRWKIAEILPRRMALFSGRRQIVVTVGNAEIASEVGRYMSAVSRFLSSNKATLLGPFAGQGVRDRAGKFHVFETDPNSLYRLAASGGSSFEQIYRIVI